MECKRMHYKRNRKLHTTKTLARKTVDKILLDKILKLKKEHTMTECEFLKIQEYINIIDSFIRGYIYQHHC